MISLEDARTRILASLTPTAAETLSLPEAWGRVTARPVVARVTQPPADVSAMDGFAVRAADALAGAVLRRIGEAPAGHPFAGAVGAGETVRIFTGSFVPEGADAILLQEDAQAEGADVTVGYAAGAWTSRRGMNSSRLGRV
jgi:molybdopterin molybdotransferase